MVQARHRSHPRARLFKAHQLLVYSRLRRQIYYDLAHACRAAIDNGRPISEEHHAILSAFSSKPEYQISRGTGYGVPGVFVQVPLIVLDKDWDVAARVRDHIAQSVSLPLSVGENSDNEDEDENETEVAPPGQQEGDSDEEQDDMDEEYEIEENLSVWEGQSAADALESHVLRFSL